MSSIRHWNDRAITFAFSALVTFELVLLGTLLVPAAEDLTVGVARLEHLCFVLLCLFGLARISLRERALMAAAIALSLVAALSPGAGEILFEGLGLASFFGFSSPC